MNNKKELIQVKVTSIKPATNKIKIFRLEYGNGEYNFRPGQWIDLYAPIEGKNIGGYTIISSADESGFIELAIKESSNHPVTRYLHNDLSVGDTLQITQGQGKFFLQDDLLESPASFTFIAGGIGITPILSMFRSIDKNLTPVKLFYSVSNEEDLVLRDELAPFAIFTVTKENSASWTGEKTRINLELLQKYNTDFNSHFFICGPRAMIDSTVDELKNYGVPSARIHFEKWW